MHSRMQRFVCPEIESLLGRRIDYLCEFGKKGEPDYELCWCKDKVEEVCENPNKPNTVKVLWDAMANSDVYKDQTESTVDLQLFGTKTNTARGGWTSTLLSCQRATTRVTKNLKMKVRVNLTVRVKLKRKTK